MQHGEAMWEEHHPARPLTEKGRAERPARETGDLLLVGHRPHLARLAGLLLCGDAGREPVNVQNSGIVCLEKSDQGTWSVRWILTPEIV